MTLSAAFWPKLPVWGIALFCLLGFPIFQASAEEMKLEVQLIWGTNDSKSPDSNHKPLDPALVKKLKMFKWKNYFVVSRHQVTVPNREAKTVKLSPQCQIEIKELEGPRVEVNVYGEGKHVKKITEGLTRQGLLTIAGDATNDCAWFIMIRQLP